MKILKLFFIILSLLVIPFAGKSQHGCYVASEDRIYTPITVLFIEVYILANAHPTTCPEGSTSATQVYVPALTGSTSCQILLSVGGSLAATGVIRNYTITNCNLDDYSWALGLGASVFGVLVIRRRNKL